MKNGYIFFDNFIFRTPLYPYDKNNIKSKISDIAFDESLFLASPEFFREKAKIAMSGKSDQKVDMSIYKYLTRATTRCTPFGLFAGCSTGYFDNTENKTIILVGQDSYERVTRLDMNYLCSLVQSLELNNEIRMNLKYYPNDSIYYIGEKLRYIEYYYIGTRRIHRISSVDPTDYLTDILTFIECGKYINEIVDYLINDEIKEDDAREYVEELISSQILKSELELCVTGQDAFDKLITQIQHLNNDPKVTSQLVLIKEYLRIIDANPFGTSLEQYQSIISIIKEIGAAFDSKYLFQTDMYKPTISQTLPQTIKEDLLSLINFMSKIGEKSQSSLSVFCKAYYERFGEREMPLQEALDSELGIGLGHDGSADIPNDLLRGVLYKRTYNTTEQSARRSKLELILLKKYIESIRNNTNKIILEDSDSFTHEAQFHDLPATIYLVCSIIGDNYFIKFGGGSCGANLLGRFCHLDSSIEKFAKSITSKDQALNSDTILAEIVHLPESRIGNILFRPILHDYEIHYLAKPGVENDFSISLSDLMISVRNDKIYLRSKRLNKFITPRLTTAHNFRYNALPVYQFLSELQTQNMRDGLFFSWGNILQGLDFKPRVQYKNFILSRAQWLVRDDLFPTADCDIKKYLNDRQMPECIVIADNDNEQYIDFTDHLGVGLFRTMLKKRKSIWCEEFLFSEGESPIKDVFGKPYCNEFIFACYKNQ